MTNCAFLFDLDGVITDTAPFHFKAWQALAASLDIHFDAAFNEQLKGISRSDSLAKILRLDKQNRSFSAAEREQLAAAKNTQYVASLAQLSPTDILPGVLPFLKRASEQQIPCVIASASQNAPRILERLGLTAYFKAIVDPTTLTNGKPDPEIFLRAAALAGVAPANCIGFEDAQAGIQAINRAGCRSVGIVTEAPLSDCHWTIASFNEISPDSIQKIFTDTKKRTL